MAKLTVSMNEAKESLGAGLLPLMGAFATILAKVGTWVQNNTKLVQVMVIVFAGLAAAVIAVNTAMKLASAATKIWAAAQWLLNAAMTANPVGLVVAAIVALIAVLVILYKKSATVRAAFQAVWTAIKAGAQAVAGVIKSAFSGAFKAVSGVLRTFWGVLRTIFTAIKTIVRGTVQVFKAVWQAGLAAVRAYFNAWKSAITAVFSAISRAVMAVVRKIGELVAKAKGLKVPDLFRTVWAVIQTSVGKVKSAVETLLSWLGRLKVPTGIGSTFDAIKAAIDRAIGAVKDLVSWIGRIKIPKIKIPGVGKSASSAPSVARAGYGAPLVAGRSGYSLGAAPMAASSGGITINVTGALDPDAVARQIQRLLGGHARRVGAAT